MGTSSSRGQIEEFSINFVNEGTKTIQFEADRLIGRGFLGPPVVKLLSVENHTKKLYQKQNLFDGGMNLTLGSRRGSQEPESTDVSGSIAPEKLTSEIMPAEYRPTLANLGNLQRKAATVTQETSGGANNHVTIPFHDIEAIGDIHNTSTTVEFYFQLRLKSGWDMNSGEKIIFRFPTSSQVYNTSTIPKVSGTVGAGSYNGFSNLVYQVQALKDGAWQTILRPDGDGAVMFGMDFGDGNNGIRMDRLESIMGESWVEGMTVSGNFQWIRVELVTLTSLNGTPYKKSSEGGPGTWPELGGIQIDNDGNTAPDDFDIANPMFFINPAGGASIFQAGAPDFLDYDLVNPNVMVSFKDVSRTGMTILTSSRFTGTIKYLVSFAG